MLPSSAGPFASGLTAHQSKYVSELREDVKAVTSLSLLDPADLASSSSSSSTGKSAVLLASGSDDGTCADGLAFTLLCQGFETMKAI